MMAMLFYAYYCNTNSQLVCGVGADSADKPTGQTDILGMNDTVGNGGYGDSNSINFWGLENWWGNKQEFVDNVSIKSRVWKVTEDDGIVRQAGTGGSSDGYISKVLFGENLDLIPTTAGGSETTRFCDYYYEDTSNTIVIRSGSKASTFGGVAYVTANSTTTASSSSCGTRLAFRGEIVIES
jgi:hypothetical protein